jgi:hypothetical protein
MGLKDIAKSGLLGVGPALVADNPKLLKGMGVLGNVAYNKIENRADDKRMAAEQAAAEEKAAAAKQQKRPMRSRPQQSSGMGGGMEGYKAMKKGGKVSSASNRADGCAQRGKTKGKMV